MNTFTTTICFGFALLLMLSGCTRDQQDVKGFVLPPGDVEVGKRTFVRLGCGQCHYVANAELPTHEQPMRFEITLGGVVRQVRSYGDLMNAIVSPDHELSPQYVQQLKADGREPGPSPMPDFTSSMTVADLIHLVEFLHRQYEASLPEYQGVIMGP